MSIVRITRFTPISRGLPILTRASHNPPCRQQLLKTVLSPAAYRHQSTMADQTIILTKDAPYPLGPYSQAIKTPTAIYLSGQLPMTPDGTLIEGTIAEKTRQACKNLEAVLKEAGSSMSKVVKVNIFLADMDYFAEMNGEYEKWFSHKPARSCVAVKTLPKNADVEFEAIALP